MCNFCLSSTPRDVVSINHLAIPQQQYHSIQDSMEVPGNVGYSIFGDESLEMWREPLAYVNKRVAEHGPVFVGRILNKPTIFVTSSSTIKELLCGKLDIIHQFWY